jgi:limonene-1,2-epoxide hydrolase
MRLAAISLAVLALTACGGHSTSPESVARAWSAALNRNDNEAAARLFAPDAQVVQEGVLTLHTQRDARHWNAALPCGGRIASIQQQAADEVLVIFHLTGRPGHQCDGPGDDAAALFTVVHGKIVIWHETAVPTSRAV